MIVKQPIITDYIEMELNEGMLYVKYKDNLKIDLEMARQIVASRLSYIENHVLPTFADTSGIASMDKEARGYFNSSEGEKGISAFAVLVKSAFSTFLANFFIKVNVINPPFPIKMFRTESAAIEWLSQFKSY